MENIDTNNLPRHIAIIMDGNGRWAKRHGLGRIAGHKKGAEAVRRVVRSCREWGIPYLTLYAFSVENWSRPRQEVNALTALLEDYLKSELRDMLENDIRLSMIGDAQALPQRVRKVLNETMENTEGNRGMVLTLALSYGSRDEIVSAVKKIVNDSRAGLIDEKDITKERFSQYLFTARMPDPDLLIRTSGEYRLSNFLLWQTAYTELYFTDVLWPDFTREHLREAIADYQRRERRFGLTSEQLHKD
ncbi:MAG: isoprenyl transferase [Deltaproteobacteria bacterium]|nr:isoprenyl transferase [Deltaproteobacteria bacterium]